MGPHNDEPSPKNPADGVQGEGNYEAARVFNEAERNFVASGRVPAAARAAAPKTDAERLEMLAAEEAGKRRARDEVPPSAKGKPEISAPESSPKDAGRQEE